MLYIDRIKNLTAVYPKLSRVWINAGDGRTPLKCVWMDEAQLNATPGATCAAEYESELAEDHLARIFTMRNVEGTFSPDFSPCTR